MNEDLKNTLSLISLEFEMLGDFYKINKDIYRSKTFYKAASIIKKLKIKKIEDLIPTLSNIKGVGSGIISRVEQFLSDKTFLDEGYSAFALERKRVNSDLNRVYGIGPAKMKELSSEYGITTVRELQIAFVTGKVDLTPTQEFGLRYVEDLNEHIPRDEVGMIGSGILSIISEVNSKNTSLIVGSYRRVLPDSGDIDILVSNSDGENTLKEIVAKIDTISYVFSIGDVNFHGVVKSKYSGKMRKLDIRYIPPSEWESALLHYTGSKNFNIYLRKLAIEKGLTLSEHGLFDSMGVRLDMKEAEIIEFLTGRYFSPPEREGEFESSRERSDISNEITNIISRLERVDSLIQERGSAFSKAEREEILSFKLILSKYSDVLMERF